MNLVKRGKMTDFAWGFQRAFPRNLRREAVDAVESVEDAVGEEKVNHDEEDGARDKGDKRPRGVGAS